MKRLLPICVFLSVFLSACVKTRQYPVVHTGVVIYNVCGNVVVQSIDGSKMGQDSWTDVNNAEKPVYKHVFRVANPCQFGQHSFGDTVHFQVCDPEVQRCSSCDMKVATPEVAYPIHVME